ncbi:hypothetical protein [Actinoplanes sp. L3-i22]|uniref:hypothetical protein n=1 Tax=Actinoplanes sp. L3-i22 TaxID=2836373 RepID=UPI001C85E291|nr:hypothetical protein [Actinoplanes sp. L3-i22]
MLVLCAVPATVAVLLTEEPYWSAALWLYIAGMAGAGVAVGWWPQLRRPAAAAGMVFAAQVAGYGTVAIRDLFNAQGAWLFGLAPYEMASRVTFAGVVALVGTVAACVAVALLWREPQRGWEAWRPRRARLLVIGVVFMIASITPGLLAGNPGEMLTGAGEGLLSIGLPCGGGLAAAAWLGSRARRAATVAVIISTVAAAASVAARLIAGMLT